MGCGEGASARLVIGDHVPLAREVAVERRPHFSNEYDKRSYDALSSLNKLMWWWAVEPRHAVQDVNEFFCVAEAVILGAPLRTFSRVSS